MATARRQRPPCAQGSTSVLRRAGAGGGAPGRMVLFAIAAAMGAVAPAGGAGMAQPPSPALPLPAMPEPGPSSEPPASSPAPASDGGNPAANRPAAAGRVARLFDFEEQEFNFEPVPRFWKRRYGAGFPRWNAGEFERRMVRSGAAAVVLPTRGGSVSLMLEHDDAADGEPRAPRAEDGAERGVRTPIPVFSDADYLVSAWLRTQGLVHARARVVARMLDGAGRPIAGAEWASEPRLSEGEWTPVAIELRSLPARSAFLQLELLLLQPDQLDPGSLLGRHRVLEQDLAGAAYFDDVAVVQLPRVSVTLKDDRHVVEAPDRPLVVAGVRDLTGESVVARLSARDVDGVLVDAADFPVDQGGSGIRWAPALPALGWYDIGLEVVAAGATIDRARTAVLWTGARPGRPGEPQGGPRHGARAFALVVDALDPALSKAAGDLIAASRAGAVTLPAIFPSGPAAAEAAARQRILLERLATNDVEVSMAISRLPTELAAQLRIDPREPLALLDHDPSLWRSRLEEVIQAYDQRVSRWQIGPLQNSDAPLPPEIARTTSRLAVLRGMLTKIIPGPRLAAPWRAEWLWPRTVGALPPPANAPAGATGPAARAYDDLVLTFPASFSSDAIGPAAEWWSQQVRARHEAPGLTVVVQTPDRETYGRRAALIEFLQRSVLLWGELDPSRPGSEWLRSRRLAASAPWERVERSGSQLVPEPELAAVAAMVHHLSGRRIIGRLPTSAAVRCFILTDAEGSPAPAGRPGVDGGLPPNAGAMIAWSESGTGADAMIRGYFGGPELAVSDVFGNTRRVQPLDAAGRYEIPLTETPVFIEGVDAALALFHTSLRIEPEFVPAVSAVHEHAFVLTNPWPVRISGEVQILQDNPAQVRRPWDYAPLSPIPFSIAPGQSQQLPFSFTFSTLQEAGERPVNAVVKLIADRPYPPMRVSADLTVGLADLDLVVGAALAPRVDGPDVVLTANVVNTGRRTRTLQIDVQAPRLAQQRQPVSNLAAGESAVRRFVFKDGARALSGRRIRVTLFDVDGAERLNKFADVP